MEDEILTEIPVRYNRIKNDTEMLSFQMNSDLFTGSLLKMLVASKRSARILEIGKINYHIIQAGFQCFFFIFLIIRL